MRNKRIFIKFIFFSFVALFLSCGLETYNFTYPILYVYNNPLYSSSDTTTYYCSFKTNETSQNENFIGTDVYYRIYNSSSALISDRNSINATNTTNNSGAAAQRMDSFGYKQLKMSPSLKRQVFIPSELSNRNVYIRLKDMYLTSDINFMAAIRVDGNYLYSGTTLVKPCRNDGSKTFDFFDDDDNDSGKKTDVKPVEGDSDYTHSSANADSETYYVQLYAVCMSYNMETLSSNDLSSASDLVDLGSIPITKHK